MTRHATIDFETRSHADLKRVGAWAYSCHPSTEVLCMSWAVGDGEVRTWRSGVIGSMSYWDDCAPLIDWVDTDGMLEAHNAFFERSIWENIMTPRYGWPAVDPGQWTCTAARAAVLALPRDLERTCAVLKTGEQKDKEGRTLLLRMMKPDNKGEWRGTGEEMDRLALYCEQDVRAERGLSEALPPLTSLERRVWLLDQEVNARGVPVDLRMLDGALRASGEARARIDADLTRATNGKVDRATRREAVLEWVNARLDDEVIEGRLEDAEAGRLDNTQGSTVDEALERDLPADVARVLSLMRAANRASTAKYQAVADRLTGDGRIRDLLMYHGAATGRWTGKGFQPHNLPRGSLKDWDGAAEAIAEGDADLLRVLYGDDMEVLSHAIRGVLLAPEGREFVVGDFAAVEARVLLWLADDRRGLDVFRRGEDIYKDMAKSIYRVPPTAVSKDQRFVGKQAILGLGFGMGADKFVANCKKYGTVISTAFSKSVVDTYREKYAAVKALWKALNDAAMLAVLEKDRTARVGRVAFACAGGFLRCRLPSGRLLYYCAPRVGPQPTPWGDTVQGVSFNGVDAFTNRWTEITTYGGKLAENVTQAVARDLLAEAALRTEEAGYGTVLHVHDELVAEVERGYGSDEEFGRLMSELPAWAEGIPVETEVWRGRRYKK